MNQPLISTAFLLDHGADIEIRDPDRSTTPLRYAIMFNKKEMIQLLLDRGANSGAITAHGTTALQLAREAAKGAYEEYEDLPSASEYGEVVELLERLGGE